MKNLKTISLLLMSSFAFAGGMEDDPLVTKVMGEIETRSIDNNGDMPILWGIEAWVGFDLNKLWLKIEGEKVADVVEEQEVQLLYSKAIAPFWDIQIGARKDTKPEDAQRDWAVIALKGLAPYLFETDAALFLGKDGQAAIRLRFEYEYMFSQKLIIAPEIELNIYAKDDVAVGVGKGLADTNLGLRLRYEFSREFAPFIGLNWHQQYGATADMSKTDNKDTSNTQVVAGVRFWL